MEKLRKVVEAEVLNWDELDGGEQHLLKIAAKVRQNAQAPYSNHFVGAAVLSEDGGIYAGCNVERVSWTQTTHAEQNAVDNMVSVIGSAKIAVVAIVAGPEGFDFEFPPIEYESHMTSFEDIGAPCGHCLQIIWENCFNDSKVKLLQLHPTGKVTRTTIGDVLTVRFGPADLGIDLR